MAISNTQTVYIPKQHQKFLKRIIEKYGSFSKFVQNAIDKEFELEEK